MNQLMTPEYLLENEWFVFALIFIILFIISFIALKKLFTKKKKINPGTALQREYEEFENKPLILFLSLAIAVLGSAGLVRNELFSEYLGNFISGWIIIFVFIVLVILLIPFVKALSNSIGLASSLVIFVAFVWSILKFGFNPYDFGSHLMQNYGSILPFQFYDFYDFITSYSALFIGLVIGLVVGLIVDKNSNS